VAIAADASIDRARQALRQLRRGRSPDDRICLACGRPIGAERWVRLHGDAFHASCARYRSERAPDT
jgi:hypothetical protein